MTDEGQESGKGESKETKSSRAADSAGQMRRLESDLVKYLSTLDPRILNERTPLNVTKVEPLGTGTRHFNYLVAINGKQYNVRFSLTPHPEEHVEYEYTSLKSVEHLNLAPKAHYRESSKEHLGLPFMIIDYVEGKHPESFTPEILREMARIVATLHGTDSNDGRFGKIRRKVTKAQIMAVISEKVEYILKKMKEYEVDLEFAAVVSNAYRKLDAMDVKSSPKGVISHGDITLSNIIMSKDGLKLIDWETMSVSDQAYDIASFFDRARLSGEQKKIFIEEYLTHTRDPTLTERLEKFEQLRVFDRMCWCIWEAFDLFEKKSYEFVAEWRTPKLYLEDGKRRFGLLKDAEVIPKDAEWNINLY